MSSFSLSDPVSDTDGHSDNMVAFARPGEVILAWTDDETDPLFQCCNSALQILQQSTDARGRKFLVHKLHCPKPMFLTEDDVKSMGSNGYERTAGTRLPASYINFYLPNGAVVLPGFGDEKFDSMAVSTLQRVFPERKVIQVQSREILLGGGNIHCCTQQQPVSRQQ